MSEKIKNRFIVIGLVMVFSFLFVWPPFDDPILVIRTVERMVVKDGRLAGKIVEWETGAPLSKPLEILSEDDDHVKEVHDGKWYRYFVRRRFDATPGDENGDPIYETVREEERTFEKEDGGSKKLNVKIVKYRQHLKVRHTLNLGLDLSGGTELVYKVVAVEEDKVEEDKDEQEDSTFQRRRDVASRVYDIVKIIERRINISGLKEPRIQVQGSDRILIQIPGRDKQEVANIKKIIQTSGRLEFRVVVDNPDTIRDATRTDVPFHKFYFMEQDETEEGEPEKLLILTKDPYNVTGSDLASAYPTQDQNGLPAVGFRFKAGKGRKFGWMSQSHINKRIAIILDGKVFSAPVIRARIDSVGIIEGGSSGFSYEEAKNLSTILSAGSLPADLINEMESEVSPFIGDDSIHSGLQAIFIAGTLVFIFMIVYYVLAGSLAVIALAFNILILLGALAMFHATLTLPGIAGILLTVGMAVDANVLVFERIREERGRRQTVFQALETGYDRAFLTIFDANTTTIITAVILIYVGTGPVRGFGITLALGILASLFTAIYVTRTIFTWLLEKEIIKDLKMREMSMLRGSNIPFLDWGKKAMMTSGVLVVLGIVFFLSRGRDNFDIDFKGGYLIHIKLQDPYKTEYIRKLVGKTDLRKPEVQQYGEVVNGGSTDFVIRTEKDYSFTFKQNPARGEDDRVHAELLFNEHVEPTIIRDRLNENEYFFDSKVEEKDDLVVISVKAVDPDGVDLDVDEVRRNIRRELEALPIYDLKNVPEIAKILLPEPFQISRDKDSGGTMTVYLVSGVNPDTVSNELKKHDLEDVDLKGKGEPDGEGKVKTLIIKGEAKHFSKIQDILRDMEDVKFAEPFPRYTQIGTAVAGDLVWKALAALVLSWVAILIYVGIRFHGLKYGAAAIIALIHDALFVLGALALADWLEIVDGKINLTMIAALLTIIGYSVNDTIVIFDRVRENVQNDSRLSEYPRLVNLSNNEMLSRTLLTSGTTLIALISLFIWGGGVIHGFAFALILGVLVGTYSTIFIACPIVVAWDRIFGSTNN